MNTRSVKSSQVPGLSVSVARIGRAVALVAERDVLGADRAEVQIDRRRARAAVEREGHRAIRAVHHEGGEDDFAGLLAVVGRIDGNRADGRGVFQRPAVELHRLIDVRVGGQRRERLLRFISGLVGRLRRRGRRRLRLLREQACRQQQERDYVKNHGQTAYRKPPMDVVLPWIIR